MTEQWNDITYVYLTELVDLLKYLEEHRKRESICDSDTSTSPKSLP